MLNGYIKLDLFLEVKQQCQKKAEFSSMGLLIRTGCQVFPYLGQIGVRLQVQLCSANWISTRGAFICQLRAWAFFFQENAIIWFHTLLQAPKLRSMPALKQSWLLFLVLKSEIIENNSTLYLPPSLLLRIPLFETLSNWQVHTRLLSLL